MFKTLKEFAVGDKGVIKTLTAEDRAVKRRLYDMGLTPGAEVTLKKVAPMGDPIQINVRGYELSLRKSEAALIVLEMK